MGAADVLIHGDTHSSAALRHELPLGIIDPFSYFEVSGRRVVVIASMEADRVKRAAPDAEVIDPYSLGLDELIARGLRRHEIDTELCLLAARFAVVPVKYDAASLDDGLKDFGQAFKMAVQVNRQLRILGVAHCFSPRNSTQIHKEIVKR